MHTKTTEKVSQKPRERGKIGNPQLPEEIINTLNEMSYVLTLIMRDLRVQNAGLGILMYIMMMNRRTSGPVSGNDVSKKIYKHQAPMYAKEVLDRLEAGGLIECVGRTARNSKLFMPTGKAIDKVNARLSEFGLSAKIMSIYEVPCLCA